MWGASHNKFALSFYHSIILSFYQSIILPFYHSIILSFYHSTILPFYHSIILSFYDSITLYLYHSIFTSTWLAHTSTHKGHTMCTHIVNNAQPLRLPRYGICFCVGVEMITLGCHMGSTIVDWCHHYSSLPRAIFGAIE